MQPKFIFHKMNRTFKQSVGIDMAKDKFDVFFSVIGENQKVTIKSTRKFGNNKTGFKEFDLWVKKLADKGLALVFTVEATGVYYEQLAWHLFGQHAHISVVLPNKARKYAESLGLKSKNDRIDAKGLSRMGAEQALEAWEPLSEDLYALRTLTREIEAIQQVKTALNNQIHALNHARILGKTTIKRLNDHVALLEKQLLAIGKELKKVVAKNEGLQLKTDKILTIKGLGLQSVVTVAAECNGFALIKNQKQLVSYAGYDVVENQSGNRAGKTRISKKGNSHIRRILHMPAFNVVKYEPTFKRFYERLIANGKTKMQAYVAVQKKLLVLIYTLWKKDEQYQREEKATSGEAETEPLFPVVCTANPEKIVAPKKGATQDGHPFETSTGALFPVGQR